MIALLILLDGATPPVLPVPSAVFADARVTTPDPRLEWPADAKLVVEEVDGELIARFDRPLAPAVIDAFRDAGGAGIGDLRWNDDSLVLRAAPGWRLGWRREGPVLRVTFVPPVAEPVPAPIDSGVESGDDAALVAIEADAAAGYPGRARRAAAALADRRPGDRRVARLLADTQSNDGDVRGAARGYRALAADDRGARRAMAAAAGTASIGVVARDGDDLAQAEFGARIDAAIDDRFSAGGGVRHVASRVKADTDIDAGTTVIDASLAAALGDAVRLQLLASAALDDGVTGGGARLVAGSAEAQFRATLLAHMPDFSTPAQVLGGGRISRALLGVTYRLTPGLVGQADVGANRYGVAGRSAASDTLVANFGLDYLVRRQFPSLGLSYRFEAEYVQRMRLGTAGLPLVSLADRENHTVQGSLGGAFGDLQVTALAGWTVDRFGGDGPTASIGLSAPIAIAWRVEGGGGITSIARPGFTGRQLYARAQLTRSLGDGR